MSKGNKIDNKNETYKEIEKNLLELVFLGDYVEKRYVWALGSYRNIIIIDKDESKLVECLSALKKHIESCDHENRWFGFTKDIDDDGNTNFVLWIDIDQSTLGKHWYRIQAIQLDAKEIKLELKCLRKFQLPMPKFQDNIPISLNALKEVMTMDNFIHTIKFSGVTFMLVLTFTINAIIHLGDYLLQLIYALSTLINALTPVILEGFNFSARCITGLFWLILMLFKSPPAIPPRFYQNSRPALQYNSRRL